MFSVTQMKQLKDKAKIDTYKKCTSKVKSMRNEFNSKLKKSLAIMQEAEVKV